MKTEGIIDEVIQNTVLLRYIKADIENVLFWIVPADSL